ncbi:MAG: VF530 family protein [Gallionella sp.]
MDILEKISSRPALEGVTLEMIITRLSEGVGWSKMSEAVPIRCFSHDPSIKSSLKFLRRTPWARTKVEQLYLEFIKARHA